MEDSSLEKLEKNEEFAKLWTRKIQNAINKSVELATNRKFEKDHEYIDFVYDECKNYVGPVAKLIDKYIDTKCSKGVALAKHFRLQGNEVFKTKIVNEMSSIDLYTGALLCAPFGHEELALAYANRSAASYQIWQYQDCIDDINMCLANNYPEEKKCKVLLRLVQCYKHLKNKTQGLKSLQLLKNHTMYPQFIETSTNLELINTLENDLNEFPNDQVDGETNQSVLPPLKTGYHKTFKGASALIDVNSSPDKGRYVVANADISRGDVLFVEEPFAIYVSHKDVSQICSHCDNDSKKLTHPCSNCTSTIYCSQNCHDVAWQQYHQWECNGITEILGDNIGLGSLAFRIMLKGAYSNFECEKKPDENMYKPVEELVTNLEKMPLENIITYTLYAVSLVSYLKLKTNFFYWYEINNFIEKSNIARHLSLILLRHLCQLQCNAHSHEIPYFEETYNRSAIYPSTSMMNHSCNANILNDYVGCHLVVRASKNIKAGEEVYNSYGCDFRSQDTKTRQDKLFSQYYFYCKCSPCQDPEYKLYYELHHAFKCQNCEDKLIKIAHNKYECVACKYKLPADSEMLHLFKEATKLDNMGKGDFKFQIKFYETVMKYIHSDNLILWNLYNKVLSAYLGLQDFENSQMIVSNSKEFLINIYGDESHLIPKKLLEQCSLVIEAFVAYQGIEDKIKFTPFQQFLVNHVIDIKVRLGEFFEDEHRSMVDVNKCLKCIKEWILIY